jgi:hypothetical protein
MEKTHLIHFGLLDCQKMSLSTLQLWEIYVIFCATNSRLICNMHQGDNAKSHRFP